jgi:PTH1 family peptidyl-tRNA hydrolase
MPWLLKANCLWSTVMKILIGLGNPGRDYVGTRHNIGFDLVEQIASRLGWVGSPERFNTVAKTKFDALALDGNAMLPDGASERILLLKPMTYMNVSGRSVQAAAGFYQLAPSDLLIVLDEMALPCGRIRIRPGGSDGGHNGLKDIQRALGTSEYPRLRVGIGPPPPPVQGRDYVLGRFSPEQREQIDPAIDRAVSAIVAWIERGINHAMNQYNIADEKNKQSEE